MDPYLGLIEHRHGWYGTFVLCFSYRTSTSFSSPLNLKDSVCEVHAWLEPKWLRQWSDGDPTPRGVVGFVFPLVDTRPGVAISVLFEHLWHLFFGGITVLPLREFNDRLPLFFVSRRFSVRPLMTRTTTLRSFLCPDGVWHSARGRRHTMFSVNSTSGIVVVTILVTTM